MRISFFSSIEFRVRKASLELEKRVSSKKSKFRVRKASFQLGKRVSSKKSEFQVRKVSFESLERFPLPLGAWDGLRYFIVALPEPSINYSS